MKKNNGKVKTIIAIISIAIIVIGCSPGRHSGHIYIHDPNHYEAVFDVPMSFEVEQDGMKIKVSSMKTGFFEEILKFLLLRPR